MRVWIVQQYAVPPGRVGFTRTHDQVRALIDAGHEALIIAAGFDHVLRESMPFPAGSKFRQDTHDGVPYLWQQTPGYSGNSLSRMWNMFRFGLIVAMGRGLRDQPQPDVILGSSPSLFAAFGAWLLALRLRCRFCMEVRDLWPESLIDLGGFSRWNPLILGLSMMERWLYWRAKVVFVVPPKAVDFVRQRGARRVMWLPNGKRLGSIPESEPPDEQGGFIFMYAGSHGTANGLHRIISAAAILQQQGHGDVIRIRLIGDGPQKPALKVQAQTLGLRNVEFLDPLPNDRIVAAQQKAHAFLMVLEDSPVFRWGVSPNKLFEYMLIGRPVVYAVNAPNDPVAEAGAGVSLDGATPEALARGMLELSRVPLERRQQMGERARRWVQAHHNLDELNKRFVAELEAGAT